MTEIMEWDKVGVAHRFLRRANGIYPEDAQTEGERQTALARQNVYYDCYMSSFSRDALVARLQQVISGDVAMPEEGDVDEAAYRAAYIKEARAVLSSLDQSDDV